jgi:hypothetical protein
MLQGATIEYEEDEGGLEDSGMVGEDDEEESSCKHRNVISVSCHCPIEHFKASSNAAISCLYGCGVCRSDMY